MFIKLKNISFTLYIMLCIQGIFVFTIIISSSTGTSLVNVKNKKLLDILVTKYFYLYRAIEFLCIRHYFPSYLYLLYKY